MAKKSLRKIIVTLTKAEKRNFKLFAQFSGKNSRYLRLFDAYLKNPQADDSTIKDQLSLSQSEFRKQKQYLVESLLKSFHFFGKGMEHSLYTLKSNIAELVKRRAFEEASLKLVKALAIAYSQEWFLEVIALIKWEKELPNKFRKIPQLEPTLATAREKMENLERFEELRVQLQSGVTQWTAVGPQISLPESILAHPLMASPEAALSGRARLEQLTLHRICQIYLGNFPLAIAYAQKIIHLLEKETDLFADRGMEICMNETNTLARLYFTTHQKDAFHRTLFQLQHKPVPVYLDSVKQELVLSTLFTYALHTGQTQLIRPYLLKLETLLEGWQDEIPVRKQVRFLFHGAFLHFVMEDYSKAIRLLNQCMRFPDDPSFRIDYRGYAKVLLLMALWEIGDVDWLEHAGASAHRYWKNKGERGAYPLAVIKLMGKIPPLPQDQSAYFSAQFGKWEATQTTQSAVRIENDLRVLPWLKSKATQLPFSQILEDLYHKGESPGLATQTG